MNKIILDLCGGTGSWSKPYKDAGYEVYNITLPDYDVTDAYPFNGMASDSFEENRGRFPMMHFGRNKSLNIAKADVHGILAAPPCTMFSLARTTAKTPRDLDQGLQMVKACMNIIWHVKPPFWVMENPKGLLRKFMGKPAFTFDASEFGEDYNKATDLWGYFKEPRKTRGYLRYPSTDKNTRKLPPIPADYTRDPEMRTQAIRRSITPQSFAQAFFKANP